MGIVLFVVLRHEQPLLQAGGHGTCLAQCRTARIVTRRTIPMQVDGEACRLNPSIIGLQLLNQAPVLAKRPRGFFETNPYVSLLSSSRRSLYQKGRLVLVRLDDECCCLLPKCRAPVLVEPLKMQVKRITMADYEVHHYDKETLQASGGSSFYICSFLFFSLSLCPNDCYCPFLCLRIEHAPTIHSARHSYPSLSFSLSNGSGGKRNT